MGASGGALRVVYPVQDGMLREGWAANKAWWAPESLWTRRRGIARTWRDLW